MLRGALDEYSNACFKSIESYEQMMSMGVSGEDARDVLPHGILTSAFVGYTLSALKKVYEQRMCCQAQSGQWQIFSKDMKNLIGVNYGPTLVTAVSAPFERGEPCGYRASFDRPCLWQKSKED
jgi:hypothetical protein